MSKYAGFCFDSGAWGGGGMGLLTREQVAERFGWTDKEKS